MNRIPSSRLSKIGCACVALSLIGTVAYWRFDRLPSLVTAAKARVGAAPFDLSLISIESGSGVAFDSLDLGADVFTVNFIGGETVFLGCRPPLPGSTPVPNLGISQANQLRFGIRNSQGNSCDMDSQSLEQDIFIVASVMNDPARNNKEVRLRLPINAGGVQCSIGACSICHKVKCSDGNPNFNYCNGDPCSSPNILYYPVKVAFIGKRQKIGVVGPEGIKTFMLDSEDGTELQQLITAVGANNLRIGVNVNRSYPSQGTFFAYAGAPVPFTINPTSRTLPVGFPDPNPINDSVAVTAANSNCYWESETDDSFFINLPPIADPPSGRNGIGSGTAAYSVEPNFGFTPRTGKVRIGGQTLTVNQLSRCSTATQISPSLSTTSGQLTVSDCLSDSGTTADYYSFNGVAGQQVVLNLSSTNFIPRVQLFDPRGSLEDEDNNFGNSQNARLPLVDDVHTLRRTGTYYIAVTTKGAIGAYTLKLRGTGEDGNCASSSSISVPGSVTGQLSASDCQAAGGFYGDSFTFFGNAGDQIAISLNSTAFDAFVSFYRPSDLSVLATDNNGGGGTNARIPAGTGFYTLPSTGTYLVVASSGPAGQTGAYTLSISKNCASGTPLGITTNPNDQTICAGGNVTLTAAASGNPAPAIQWQESPPGCVNKFVNLTGATGPTLTLTNVAAAKNGARYRVVFTNSCGTAESAVATLAVNGFSLSPTVQSLPPSVGSGTIDVTASTNLGCSRTAVSNVPWISVVSGATGSGNGRVTYNVQANPGAARSGTITIGGQTFTVLQSGCPSITVNPATISTGTIGSVYPPATFTGSGGTGSYTCGVSAGSPPPGLNLVNCVLSGTPTQSGNFTFTIRLTDTQGCQGTRQYTVPVSCPPIVINPTTIQQGTIGVNYNQNFTQTGGIGTTIFSVSAGSLPPGLSLSNGGLLSGIPAQSGSFNFTVKATDANGCFGTRSYELTIRGLQYYPLAQPIRLLDTRANAKACDTPGAPLSGEAARTQQARGPCGGATIPDNAQAIVGNATVVNFISGAGFITLYPTGAQQPTVSNLNYLSNQIIPNAFTVGLSSNGQFNIYASTTTDFIVDITGYYAPPGAAGSGGLYYHPLPQPVRLLDTRPGATACTTPQTPIQGGTSLAQNARVTCHNITIPANAQAVVGNATVVNFLSGAGFITLFPTGGTQPTASNLNYLSNQIIPNAFTVGLNGDGQFSVFASSATHFIADITGYYSADPRVDVNGVAGLSYNPLSRPIRVVDTRPRALACTTPGSPIPGGGTLPVRVRVTCDGVTIPATAQAVAGNATVVNFLSGAGFVTLFPCGSTPPVVSNLNYLPNQIIPNAFIVSLNADGEFCIFVSSGTHFIADLTGYFSP